jgi:hypothetical protein
MTGTQKCTSVRMARRVEVLKVVLANRGESTTGHMYSGAILCQEPAARDSGVGTIRWCLSAR